jgi:hypothetical protein
MSNQFGRGDVSPVAGNRERIFHRSRTDDRRWRRAGTGQLATSSADEQQTDFGGIHSNRDATVPTRVGPCEVGVHPNRRPITRPSHRVLNHSAPRSTSFGSHEDLR